MALIYIEQTDKSSSASASGIPILNKAKAISAKLLELNLKI